MAIGSSADLLNLLATCLPDDEQLEKAAQIETLVSMPAYAELRQNAEFHREFEQYYAPAVLQGLSLMQIRKARSAIPVAAECLGAIRGSLHSGPAPDLTPADRPDFYSGLSLRMLADRLQEPTGPNYTNIPEDEFMTIFSPDTIRSAPEIFGSFRADATDMQAETARVCSGRCYCVSADELAHLEHNYEQALDEMSREGRASTNGWLGWRRNRIFLGLGLFLGVAAVNFLGGNLTNLIGSVTCIGTAVLAVLLAVWG